MSSDAPICISGRPGSASVSTQASSEKTGSAGADTQALRKSTRQADKSGSYGAGPSAPTKRHPLTQGMGSKTSPKSQALAVGARLESTAGGSARPSEKLLVEGLWVNVWGIFIPGLPSAKSKTASKKKAGYRPGKGHDDPIQCLNKCGTLEIRTRRFRL